MQRTPADSIHVETHLLSPSEAIPNHPTLPLMVYRKALSDTSRGNADQVERLIQKNRWTGTWQNGVFPFHHFHSNAHEVLAVCSGRAQVHFGGPDGPAVQVESGDVAILPPGTGHKRIDATGDFLLVGGYPEGQEDYDLMRGDPAELPEAEKRIVATPLPAADPIYGADGPLLAYWEEK
jgi:uncharacterized protein YjlB